MAARSVQTGDRPLQAGEEPLPAVVRALVVALLEAPRQAG
jgi:hypothetical protein